MARFSQDSKANVLARAPLFEGLSRKDLVALAKLTEDMDVPAGKVLCKQGDVGHEFFVILEGDADVTRGVEHITTLGPGEMFGEIALLEHIPRTATVTAKTPLRFFVMTSQSFWSLIDHHPDIEPEILRTLARRVLSDSRSIPD